jgi:hypothetical protein
MKTGTVDYRQCGHGALISLFDIELIFCTVRTILTRSGFFLSRTAASEPSTMFWTVFIQFEISETDVDEVETSKKYG